MTKRGLYAAAAILIVTAAAAGIRCAGADSKPTPPIAQFTDGGVAVTMELKGWDGKTGVLETTFTPLRPGFHLYSIALPPTGIDGIGRPTVVKVSGSLAASGPLTANMSVHDLTPAGSTVALPVYPDGPVTTTLPITAGATGRAHLVVGYAACSATLGCLFPFTGHEVDADVSQRAVSLTPR